MTHLLNMMPASLVAGNLRRLVCAAVTAGLRIARDLSGAVTVDVAFNFYRQKSAWRAGGGSPGLEDFSARWIEAGIEKRF